MGIKTVVCKLKTTPEDEVALDALLIAFAEGCNLALAIANETGKRSRFALQGVSYYRLRRECGLGGTYASKVVARVAAAKRPIRLFRPTAADLHRDTCRLIPGADAVNINVNEGRRTIAISAGDYQRNLLAGVRETAGVLVKKRDGFYVHITVKTSNPEPTGSAPLGVDLGINRILTDSDGNVRSGQRVNYRRTKYQRVRNSLQRKNTKGAKRVLKRLSGRERRFQRDVNHCLSKGLVAYAKADDRVLVMEDLKGIKQRTAKKGKRLRSMMGRWAFYQLREFVTYKAAEAGVTLAFVDPAYTSKTCPKCGCIGTRAKHSFRCTCGYRGDADIVGALNIAQKWANVTGPQAA